MYSVFDTYIEWSLPVYRLDSVYLDGFTHLDEQDNDVCNVG